MGETHGGYLDHKAAKKVLEVLSKVLNIKISTEKLKERAKASEELIKRIEEEGKRIEEFKPTTFPKKPPEITYIR